MGFKCVNTLVSTPSFKFVQFLQKIGLDDLQTEPQRNVWILIFIFVLNSATYRLWDTRNFSKVSQKIMIAGFLVPFWITEQCMTSKYSDAIQRLVCAAQQSQNLDIFGNIEILVMTCIKCTFVLSNLMFRLPNLSVDSYTETNPSLLLIEEKHSSDFIMHYIKRYCPPLVSVC